MDPQYRRYGRWLKRAAWILAIYLFAAWLFMGLSPSQSISDPELVISQLRPFMLQAMILVFFIILQFGAMFWFLSRGNDYVIYPNEYDTSFDDVRGQPAAVESTQEVLRVFEGFKDFKQMGGYPPHGILFEGPGTGKTLMAKAIAGASGVPFLFATGSGFAAMFVGIGNLKVRRLFKKARVMSDKYGGSVIFIDEIDAVGSRAGSRPIVRAIRRPIASSWAGWHGRRDGRHQRAARADGRVHGPPRIVASHPADRVPRQAEGALLQHPRDRGDEPRRDLGRRARPSGTIRPQDPRRTSRRRGEARHPGVLPGQGPARADRLPEALSDDGRVLAGVAEEHRERGAAVRAPGRSRRPAVGRPVAGEAE